MPDWPPGSVKYSTTSAEAAAVVPLGSVKVRGLLFA